MNKFLLLPFLFLSMSVFGQENWETSLKAGTNCSFFGSSSNKVFFGGIAGLEQIYNFDNSIFSVQSGFEFENIGAGMSSLTIVAGNSNPSNNTFSRTNANYLSVPFHFRCKINEHWGALAGAAYRFGISGGQSGSRSSADDFCLDAGFFYMMKKVRFNLMYQHGLSKTNLGSQWAQSKNRTITLSISSPFWNN